LGLKPLGAQALGIIEAAALLVIMVTLAAIPSASVALVVTRSATLSVGNGIAVSAGIVLGDLVFVMLALLGLSVIAETLGGFFVLVKYVGAAYLIWLGYTLLTRRADPGVTTLNPDKSGNLIVSFVAGLMLTLGDLKAIVFYVSLFPLIVDPATMRFLDILLVVAITVFAVGGVKVVYAVSAAKIVSVSRASTFQSAVRKTAGGFLVGAGSYLIIKN